MTRTFYTLGLLEERSSNWKAAAKAYKRAGFHDKAHSCHSKMPTIDRRIKFKYFSHV